MLFCLCVAEKVKLCPSLPIYTLCVYLFMPKYFLLFTEVFVARFCCHKPSLDLFLSFSLGRNFAHKVSFRPNSIYMWTALKNVPFYHFTYQLTSFIFFMYYLALLKDWCQLTLIAWGRFAYFLMTWLINLVFSIFA